MNAGVCSLDVLEGSSPAQQLRVGEDLLQAAVVADAEGEGRLSRLAGKVSGYSCWEGQHHLSCDLHNAPVTPGGGERKEKSLKSRNILVVKLFSREIGAYLLGSAPLK